MGLLSRSAFEEPTTGTIATDAYLIAGQSSISANPNTISFYIFIYWSKSAYEAGKQPIHVRQVQLPDDAIVAFEQLSVVGIDTVSLFTAGLAKYYQYLLSLPEFANWEVEPIV